MLKLQEFLRCCCALYSLPYAVTVLNSDNVFTSTTWFNLHCERVPAVSYRKTMFPNTLWIFLYCTYAFSNWLIYLNINPPFNFVRYHYLCTITQSLLLFLMNSGTSRIEHKSRSCYKRRLGIKGGETLSQLVRSRSNQCLWISSTESVQN